MITAVTVLNGINPIANGVNQLKSAVNQTVNQSSFGTCTKRTTRGTVITPIGRFRKVVADDVPETTSSDTDVWW